MKKNKKWIFALLTVCFCLVGGTQAGWMKDLERQLPLLGHRNWIVIADSAYPLQIAPGIQTVYVGGDQLDVLRTVLDEIAKCRHVRPVVFLDSELAFVAEKSTPGVGEYRRCLEPLLADSGAKRLPHEKIIQKLDEAGGTFKVLIIKTDMVIPYSSIFIRLDCGYWSDNAEKTLREAVDQHGKEGGM